MTDLNKMGLAQARDALRKGETTSKELTQACLTAIEGAGALRPRSRWSGPPLPMSA